MSNQSKPSVLAYQQGFTIIAQIVQLLASLVLGLIGLRVVPRLLGAAAEHPFVNWVYSTSEPLVSPFYGIFNRNVITAATSRIDLDAIIALIVYSIVFGILTAVLWPRHRAA